MRKKRIMIIGSTNCGKTTLVNALNDEEKPLRKTQNLIYGENTIDVPGSYIENPWMYKYIISAMQDASHVLILVDPSNFRDAYPPGFAKVFRCPVIGVITKMDIMEENEAMCIRQLQKIGVSEPYFNVSVHHGKGLTILKEYLFTREEGNEGGK